MNDGLFEDYGEAMLYVALAVLALGLMMAALDAFTAY